jgi:hypothetical protein
VEKHKNVQTYHRLLGGAAHRQGNLTLGATVQTKMNALVISSCTIIFYA